LRSIDDRLGRIMRVAAFLFVWRIARVTPESSFVGNELEDESEIRSNPFALLLDEGICGKGSNQSASKFLIAMGEKAFSQVSCIPVHPDNSFASPPSSRAFAASLIQ
jgi:hypothetical protein